MSNKIDRRWQNLTAGIERCRGNNAVKNVKGTRCRPQNLRVLMFAWTGGRRGTSWPFPKHHQRCQRQRYAVAARLRHYLTSLNKPAAKCGLHQYRKMGSWMDTLVRCWQLSPAVSAKSDMIIVLYAFDLRFAGVSVWHYIMVGSQLRRISIARHGWSMQLQLESWSSWIVSAESFQVL